MKYIISTYNQDPSWVKKYTDDYVIYDRSDREDFSGDFKDIIRVDNRGSDIFDKFTYIIDNYDTLPDCGLYTKCNIFKYTTEEEFEKVKDNTTFTPILTANHQEREGVCYYKDGIYWEVNNMWYLGAHPCKNAMVPYELQEILGIGHMDFVPFAPGSNYILPKENILKHPKAFYEKLRSYLDWAVYPGEAQLLERALYTLWKD